ATGTRRTDAAAARGQLPLLTGCLGRRRTKPAASRPGRFPASACEPAVLVTVELPFARAHRQPSVEVATGLGRQFDLQPVAPATDFEFDDARAAVATDRGDGAGYRSCLAVAEFEVVRPEVEAGGTVGQVGARQLERVVVEINPARLHLDLHRVRGADEGENEG